MFDFVSIVYFTFSLDWMDSEDKVKVMEKINDIRFVGSIQAWIRSNEAVESRTPKYNFNLSLVANDILTQRNVFKRQV